MTTTCFEPSRASTNSLGRVVLPFLIPCLINGGIYPGDIIANPADKVTLSITQGTGDISLFQENLVKYYMLYTFAKTFIQQMTDTPPEFDEYFKENFWDLLA